MIRSIVIDCKLLGLTSSGIPIYFKPLMAKIISNLPEQYFYLVASQPFNLDFLPPTRNYELVICPQPKIPFSKLKKLIYHFFSYPKFLSRLDADFLLASYYDFAIPRKYKDRSAFFIYDMCYWNMPNCYQWFSRIFHKLLFRYNKDITGHIFTISQSSRNQILSRFPEVANKLSIIYCSFISDWKNKTFTQEMTDNLRRKLNIDDRKVFLYTGGVDSRKNISGMLKAFSIFVKVNPQYALVITGNYANHPLLQPLIEKLELQNCIILTGYLTSDELGCMYQNVCHAALTVSFYEGFGLTALEAKTLGVPLLCSNLDVFRETIAEYPIYCDPNDIRDIVNGMEKLARTHRRINIEVESDERFEPEKNEQLFIEYFFKITQINRS